MAWARSVASCGRRSAHPFGAADVEECRAVHCGGVRVDEGLYRGVEGCDGLFVCLRYLWGACWGGGVEVRNLPRFTAILPQFYRNFSVMPLLKNFRFSPEDNLFEKKSCAPLLLMAGIESGDQKEMYRNFYRNFTAISRSFTAIFSGVGDGNPPPPQLRARLSLSKPQAVLFRHLAVPPAPIDPPPPCVGLRAEPVRRLDYSCWSLWRTS